MFGQRQMVHGYVADGQAGGFQCAVQHQGAYRRGFYRNATATQTGQIGNRGVCEQDIGPHGYVEHQHHHQIHTLLLQGQDFIQGQSASFQMPEP